MVWIVATYLYIIPTIAGVDQGFMLLYRPLDVTKDCRESSVIRHYISYGMGMSDTISLAFKTRSIPDYQCMVEIICEPDIPIVFVVQYPNTMAENCAKNAEAFSSITEDKVLNPFCRHISKQWRGSKYFTTVVWEGHFMFHFKSTKNINEEMMVDYYLVTVTSASILKRDSKGEKKGHRLNPPLACQKKNETLCIVENDQLCFTNGVVCDGIKNCGVSDWYDERSSVCQPSPVILDAAAALTVLVSVVCALIAIGHAVSRCISPLATTFFIFNANEDNRLQITTVQLPPASTHIIPIIATSSGSSNCSATSEDSPVADVINLELARLSMTVTRPGHSEHIQLSQEGLYQDAPRQSVFNTMMERFTSTLRKLSRRPHYEHEAATATEDQHEQCDRSESFII